MLTQLIKFFCFLSSLFSSVSKDGPVAIPIPTPIEIPNVKESISNKIPRMTPVTALTLGPIIIEILI